VVRSYSINNDNKLNKRQQIDTMCNNLSDDKQTFETIWKNLASDDPNERGNSYNILVKLSKEQLLEQAWKYFSKIMNN